MNAMKDIFLHGICFLFLMINLYRFDKPLQHVAVRYVFVCRRGVLSVC